VFLVFHFNLGPGHELFCLWVGNVAHLKESGLNVLVPGQRWIPEGHHGACGVVSLSLGRKLPFSLFQLEVMMFQQSHEHPAH
jgi:hypothetical protein